MVTSFRVCHGAASEKLYQKRAAVFGAVQVEVDFAWFRLQGFENCRRQRLRRKRTPAQRISIIVLYPPKLMDRSASLSLSARSGMNLSRVTLRVVLLKLSKRS